MRPHEIFRLSLAVEVEAFSCYIAVFISNAG